MTPFDKEADTAVREAEERAAEAIQKINDKIYVAYPAIKAAARRDGPSLSSNGPLLIPSLVFRQIRQEGEAPTPEKIAARLAGGLGDAYLAMNVDDLVMAAAAAVPEYVASRIGERIHATSIIENRRWTEPPDKDRDLDWPVKTEVIPLGQAQQLASAYVKSQSPRIESATGTDDILTSYEDVPHSARTVYRNLVLIERYQRELNRFDNPPSEVIREVVPRMQNLLKQEAEKVTPMAEVPGQDYNDDPFVSPTTDTLIEDNEPDFWVPEVPEYVADALNSLDFSEPPDDNILSRDEFFPGNGDSSRDPKEQEAEGLDSQVGQERGTTANTPQRGQQSSSSRVDNTQPQPTPRTSALHSERRNADRTTRTSQPVAPPPATQQPTPTTSSRQESQEMPTSILASPSGNQAQQLAMPAPTQTLVRQGQQPEAEQDQRSKRPLRKAERTGPEAGEAAAYWARRAAEIADKRARKRGIRSDDVLELVRAVSAEQTVDLRVGFVARRLGRVARVDGQLVTLGQLVREGTAAIEEQRRADIRQLFERHGLGLSPDRAEEVITGLIERAVLRDLTRRGGGPAARMDHARAVTREARRLSRLEGWELVGELLSPEPGRGVYLLHQLRGATPEERADLLWQHDREWSRRRWPLSAWSIERTSLAPEGDLQRWLGAWLARTDTPEQRAREEGAATAYMAGQLARAGIAGLTPAGMERLLHVMQAQGEQGQEISLVGRPGRLRVSVDGVEMGVRQFVRQGREALLEQARERLATQLADKLHVPREPRDRAGELAVLLLRQEAPRRGITVPWDETRRVADALRLDAAATRLAGLEDWRLAARLLGREGRGVSLLQQLRAAEPGGLEDRIERQGRAGRTYLLAADDARWLGAWLYPGPTSAEPEQTNPVQQDPDRRSARARDQRDVVAPEERRRTPAPDATPAPSQEDATPSREVTTGSLSMSAEEAIARQQAASPQPAQQAGMPTPQASGPTPPNDGAVPQPQAQRQPEQPAPAVRADTIPAVRAYDNDRFDRIMAAARTQLAAAGADQVTLDAFERQVQSIASNLSLRLFYSTEGMSADIPLAEALDVTVRTIFTEHPPAELAVNERAHPGHVARVVGEYERNSDRMASLERAARGDGGQQQVASPEPQPARERSKPVLRKAAQGPKGPEAETAAAYRNTQARRIAQDEWARKRGIKARDVQQLVEAVSTRQVVDLNVGPVRRRLGQVALVDGRGMTLDDLVSQGTAIMRRQEVGTVARAFEEIGLGVGSGQARRLAASLLERDLRAHLTVAGWDARTRMIQARGLHTMAEELADPALRDWELVGRLLTPEKGRGAYLLHQLFSARPEDRAALLEAGDREWGRGWSTRWGSGETDLLAGPDDRAWVTDWLARTAADTEAGQQIGRQARRYVVVQIAGTSFAQAQGRHITRGEVTALLDALEKKVGREVTLGTRPWDIRVGEEAISPAEFVRRAREARVEQAQDRLADALATKLRVPRDRAGDLARNLLDREVSSPFAGEVRTTRTWLDYAQRAVNRADELARLDGWQLGALVLSRREDAGAHLLQQLRAMEPRLLEERIAGLGRGNLLQCGDADWLATFFDPTRPRPSRLEHLDGVMRNYLDDLEASPELRAAVPLLRERWIADRANRAFGGDQARAAEELVQNLWGTQTPRELIRGLLDVPSIGGAPALRAALEDFQSQLDTQSLPREREAYRETRSGVVGMLRDAGVPSPSDAAGRLLGERWRFLSERDMLERDMLERAPQVLHALRALNAAQLMAVAAPGTGLTPEELAAFGQLRADRIRLQVEQLLQQRQALDEARRRARAAQQASEEPEPVQEQEPVQRVQQDETSQPQPTQEAGPTGEERVPPVSPAMDIDQRTTAQVPSVERDQVQQTAQGRIEPELQFFSWSSDPLRDAPQTPISTSTSRPSPLVGVPPLEEMPTMPLSTVRPSDGSRDAISAQDTMEQDSSALENILAELGVASTGNVGGEPRTDDLVQGDAEQRSDNKSAPLPSTTEQEEVVEQRRQAASASVSPSTPDTDQPATAQPIEQHQMEAVAQPAGLPGIAITPAQDPATPAVEDMPTTSQPVAAVPTITPTARAEGAVDTESLDKDRADAAARQLAVANLDTQTDISAQFTNVEPAAVAVEISTLDSAAQLAAIFSTAPMAIPGEPTAPIEDIPTPTPPEHAISAVQYRQRQHIARTMTVQVQWGVEGAYQDAVGALAGIIRASAEARPDQVSPQLSASFARLVLDNRVEDQLGMEWATTLDPRTHRARVEEIYHQAVLDYQAMTSLQVADAARRHAIGPPELLPNEGKLVLTPDGDARADGNDAETQELDTLDVITRLPGKMVLSPDPTRPFNERVEAANAPTGVYDFRDLTELPPQLRVMALSTPYFQVVFMRPHDQDGAGPNPSGQGPLLQGGRDARDIVAYLERAQDQERGPKTFLTPAEIAARMPEIVARCEREGVAPFVCSAMPVSEVWVEMTRQKAHDAVERGLALAAVEVEGQEYCDVLMRSVEPGRGVYIDKAREMAREWTRQGGGNPHEASARRLVPLVVAPHIAAYEEGSRPAHIHVSDGPTAGQREKADTILRRVEETATEESIISSATWPLALVEMRAQERDPEMMFVSGLTRSQLRELWKVGAEPKSVTSPRLGTRGEASFLIDFDSFPDGTSQLEIYEALQRRVQQICRGDANVRVTFGGSPERVEMGNPTPDRETLAKTTWPFGEKLSAAFAWITRRDGHSVEARPELARQPGNGDGRSSVAVAEKKPAVTPRQSTREQGGTRG